MTNTSNGPCFHRAPRSIWNPLLRSKTPWSSKKPSGLEPIGLGAINFRGFSPVRGCRFQWVLWPFCSPCSLGSPWGPLRGYLGGTFDAIVSWLLQVIWSIPTLLLVLAITLAFGKGFQQVFLAIGLSMWVEVARVVRGQTMALRNMEWAEAGRVLGLSTPRIVLGHILPNLAGPIAVIASANFAAAILIEAGLSFMGVGAQIPMPSWGNLIRDHYGSILTGQAHLALVPGACIVTLVLAFNALSNALARQSSHRGTP